MARVCEITGKTPLVGNHVSHAKNRVKRRMLPNLQRKKYWVPSKNRYVRLLISVKGLRIIDKIGIDAALHMLQTRKEEERG